MSFFKCLYDFNEYKKILKKPFYKGFIQFILLILISYLYIFLPLIAPLKIFTNKEELNKYIPNFEIKNEELIIDKKINHSIPNLTTIIVDTTKNASANDLAKYKIGLALGKDRLFVKVSSGQIQELDIVSILKNLDIYNKNSKNLYIIISSFFSFMIIALIFALIIRLLILVLISMLILKIIARIKRFEITLKQLFNVSVYINTMPTLLTMFLSFFLIGLPFLVYLGIIIAYSYYVIVTVKNDNLIN